MEELRSLQVGVGGALVAAVIKEMLRTMEEHKVTMYIKQSGTYPSERGMW
uniref:Uncharacterized protein n=1 Tax=Aegilops tauschii TaxID=37682 RepID=M8BVM7_AEGTA